MARLQSGEVGQFMAEQWFRTHGWRMFRSQPPIHILAYLNNRSAMGTALLRIAKKYLPRLACYGQMVLGRLDKGGIADYTGLYAPPFFLDPPAVPESGKPLPTARFFQSIFSPGISMAQFLACEVKEWNKGNTMPASNLSLEQRQWLSALPPYSAWVGILWASGAFTMHRFQPEGSYDIVNGIS